MKTFQCSFVLWVPNFVPVSAISSRMDEDERDEGWILRKILSQCRISWGLDSYKDKILSQLLHF
jgi:hypothetical protein